MQSLFLEFLAGRVGVPGGQPEPPQVARGFADLAQEFGHLAFRMVNVAEVPPCCLRHVDR